MSSIYLTDRHCEKIAEGYENLITAIDWNKTSKCFARLSEFEKLQAMHTQGGFSTPDTSRLAVGCLNPLLNAGEITRQYQKNTPNLAYFDDFLSKDTLYKLRKFLLESIIWHDFRHIEGFLAAYLENGLANPMLLQIGQEVKAAFPEILGSLPLTQVWAFKELQGDQGIDIHSDSGGVSLNFWLTPDDANLDPDHGGMEIYEKEPPIDWQLKNYSQDTERIQQYLSHYESKTIRIPYRENRCVVFKSELFHKSDLVNFKPGYTNHRINITMIFGFDRIL